MSNVTAFGPAVLDRRLVGDTLERQDKMDCRILESGGGGSVNCLRAAARMNSSTHLLMLKAPDAIGRRLMQVLAHEHFDEVVSMDILEQTRESILIGDRCFTQRPQAITNTLPRHAARRLWSADIAIISPLGADCWQLAQAALAASRRSLLQLSSAQLSEPCQAVALAKLATWTIVNEGELQQWTACDSVRTGLRQLQAEGVSSVLVTSSAGVSILDEAGLRFIPSFPVAAVHSTVGAGDCFVGSLASMLGDGLDVDNAVRTAQLQAARHISGAFASPPWTSPSACPSAATSGNVERRHYIFSPLALAVTVAALLACAALLAPTPPTSRFPVDAVRFPWASPLSYRGSWMPRLPQRTGRYGTTTRTSKAGASARPCNRQQLEACDVQAGLLGGGYLLRDRSVSCLLRRPTRCWHPLLIGCLQLGAVTTGAIQLVRQLKVHLGPLNPFGRRVGDKEQLVAGKQGALPDNVAVKATKPGRALDGIPSGQVAEVPGLSQLPHCGDRANSGGRITLHCEYVSPCLRETKPIGACDATLALTGHALGDLATLREQPRLALRRLVIGSAAADADQRLGELLRGAAGVLANLPEVLGAAGAPHQRAGGRAQSAGRGFLFEHRRQIRRQLLVQGHSDATHDNQRHPRGATGGGDRIRLKIRGGCAAHRRQLLSIRGSPWQLGT
ncbi:MAG: hypothetical protein KDB14_20380 [Planctomycetales bacterium]|nr:hypothetical protein [Planctomycetales bacterium]